MPCASAGKISNRCVIFDLDRDCATYLLTADKADIDSLMDKFHLGKMKCYVRLFSCCGMSMRETSLDSSFCFRFTFFFFKTFTIVN